MQLVLASGSPRRARALTMLGVAYVVEPPDVDERRSDGESPEQMVTRLARLKAAEAGAGTLRLALDTVVVAGGDVVGKPADPEEAVEALLRLGGRTHAVVSGWALATSGRTVSGTAMTEIRFRAIEPHEATAYVATGEPMDKAGSYAVQGFGSRFISGVSGSLTNVMGFPAEQIVPALLASGVAVLRPDAALVRMRVR